MCEAEGPSAWQEKVRKANKEHRCIACKETIRVGDVYNYSSGIWDGRPESYHHCLRCFTMLRALMDISQEPVDLHLACGNNWEDVFDDPPPEHLLKLAFMTPDEAQKELR